jgi:hypothetical protein
MACARSPDEALALEGWMALRSLKAGRCFSVEGNEGASSTPRGFGADGFLGFSESGRPDVSTSEAEGYPVAGKGGG